MGKYYAVRKGKNPGIYTEWSECSSNIIGFKGAEYKSFKTMEEAEEYMSRETKSYDDIDLSCLEAYAFTDGSFNSTTKVYGYGGFLIHRVYDEELDELKENKYILKGKDNDEEMASMRNVAGEILGSQAAMEKAISLGIDDLTILYDYYGIEMWATGEWERNKTGTKKYYEYYNSIKGKLNVHFVKVKGHTGIEGNDEADKLAKESVGIGLI